MGHGKDQHVVPHGDDWAVKGTGNSKATAVTSTKQEAIDKAREISQNQKSELFIHNKDGKFGSRDSHGYDPRKSKG